MNTNENTPAAVGSTGLAGVAGSAVSRYGTLSEITDKIKECDARIAAVDYCEEKHQCRRLRRLLVDEALRIEPNIPQSGTGEARSL